MKRHLTRLLSLLLLLSALLLLSVGCGDAGYYAPVESSARERETVLTLSYGEKNYSVPYEVYRAFFLTYRDAIDGGDHSVWSGPDAEAYVTEIRGKILPRIAEIYATLYLAEKIGYRTDTSACDTLVREKIRDSVNASVDDGGTGGDYDAYLNALKEMNLNYSVQDLLIRYSLAYTEVLNYYGGVENETDPSARRDPHLSYTEADVRRFYESDECVLVLTAMLDARSYTAARAKEIRDRLAACTTREEASRYIMGHTATTASDGVSGMLIGRYSLDDAYYTDVADTAFALPLCGTSEPITISDGSNTYYCILYRVEKEAGYDATDVYVQNEIGKLLLAVRDSLLAGAEITDALTTADHATISMD